MKFFCYRHIRLDKNVPFYVGIGKKPSHFRKYVTEYKRAFDLKWRSNIWLRVYNKTEIEVEILCEAETEQEIMKKEVEFIKLYGRRNKNLGTLVNLTDGGEGVAGRVTSQKEKDRLRGWAIKNASNEENKAKMRERMKGRPSWNKGLQWGPETRKKIGNSKRGKSLPKRGPASPQERERLRTIRLGLTPWIAGRKHSAESREKMSKSRTGKIGKIANRYVHGDRETKLYEVWCGIVKASNKKGWLLFFTNYMEFKEWAISSGYVETTTRLKRVNRKLPFTKENCIFIPNHSIRKSLKNEN